MTTLDTTIGVKRSRTADETVSDPAFQSGPPARKRKEDGDTPNHILLLTILNPMYPITVEVLHAICNPHSRVLRIVIFQKNGVQAMVEFESVAGACAVKQAINGADIYSGCCTVRVEFARTNRLNVFRNDTRTFDYTCVQQQQQQPADGGCAGSASKAPLLGEPGASSMSNNSHLPPLNPNYTPGMQGTGVSPAPSTPSMFPPAGSAQGALTPHAGGNSGNYAIDYGIYKAAEEYMRGGAYGAGAGYPGGGGSGHVFGCMLTSRIDKRSPVMAQPGAVVMVYGVNFAKLNCKRLFNVFCLYGNVSSIRFLMSKEGTVMVQMEDQQAAERAITHLARVELFGNQLQLSQSKQHFVTQVREPENLPDGTPCFEDFSTCRENRFLDQKSASRNRISYPTRMLHFYNTPPNLTEELVMQLILENSTVTPLRVKMFPARTSRSSSGLVEFASVTQAVEAMAMCNHVPVAHITGAQPYVAKLCFSSARTVDSL